ncbi:hypothetical protein [Novacetimonas pomaceti]|uniref:Uncharacterized protein n=1 Tax=Novacetimonas pomaceti TaxID=2021998 RepID=A0A318QRI9_9PROT|nr:hypothetical protein [Novacetimonas pomaceti]MBV1835329.1 hypothetical protein [Novacetimonas pomaceti]PYD75333.1 hypothetical protein CFR71_09540 [Novacetimonas pomaceti]
MFDAGREGGEAEASPSFFDFFSGVRVGNGSFRVGFAGFPPFFMVLDKALTMGGDLLKTRFTARHTSRRGPVH